jgi:hypothetical protein
MGLLDAGVSKRAFKCALPYDAEPTHERPTSGDWITSGTTKSGVRYEKAVTRKAATLYFEVNGVLLDPPLEGRPTKRRRSNSPEPAIEDDPNLKNAIIMSVGIEKVAEQEQEQEEDDDDEDDEEMVDETEEEDDEDEDEDEDDEEMVDETEEEDDEDEDEDEDDEEMVDETPEPPEPAPIVLARLSPRRPRPSAWLFPDASRPKHFQYLPVTPSPLRMVSTFDSPEGSPK